MELACEEQHSLGLGTTLAGDKVDRGQLWCLVSARQLGLVDLPLRLLQHVQLQQTCENWKGLVPGGDFGLTGGSNIQGFPSDTTDTKHLVHWGTTEIADSVCLLAQSQLHNRHSLDYDGLADTPEMLVGKVVKPFHN